MSQIIYPHLGYYKVGDKFFNDKIEAIVHANTTLADIEWNFHKEVYDKVDWTKEPELSLDTFYKLRAQQIRDQYDYVIVMCSGGGDSTNIVFSFLENNIHVDEVIASAPVSGLNNFEATTDDNAPDNTMSETKYAQMPLMQEISQRFPNTKITINDYFENMQDFKTDDWLFRCGEWIHPSSGARYNLEKLTHLRNMAEAGKKIGIVYGIDKPILAITKTDELYLVLADRAVNVQRPAFEKNYPNVQNVLFYFTPEMPLLQVKQAHVVANWVHQPENAHVLALVKQVASGDKYVNHRHRNSRYQRAIIPCIYPSTYRPVFQGHKPTRMFLGEHDAWFYQMHGQTRMYEMIDSDFRNFYNAINQKYLNQDKTGFVPFIQTYRIGNVSDFKKGPLLVF
jgi:hypothetical protein